MRPTNAVDSIPRPAPSERWTRDLSFAECMRRGWSVYRVGWYDARAQRNHDLLGGFDLLAFGEGKTFAIQHTSDTNAGTRLRKLAGLLSVREAQAAGWHVLVWGWRHNGELLEAVLDLDARDKT